MLMKSNTLISTVKSVYIITALITGSFIKFNYAEEIYSLVSTYFISYDSLLETTAGEVSRISKLDNTEKFLLEKIETHQEIEYLMRINSKGKMISKVMVDKILPRSYRYVGKQMWYKTMKLNKKPYYGNVVNRKGYYLFWARPVTVKTKYGSRFGGALVAKIDLQKIFNNIAEKDNIKFQIKYRKKNVFSNLGKNVSGSFIERKLAVYGMPGLTLKYKKSVVKREQVAISSVKQQDKKVTGQKPASVKEKSTKEREKKIAKAKKVDRKVVAKDVQKKKPVSKAVVYTKKEEKKAAGAQRIIVSIIFIIICLALVVLSFFVMKRAADKNRKIIESIDRGEV